MVSSLKKKNQDLEALLCKKPDTKVELIKFNIDSIQKVLTQVNTEFKSSKYYEDKIENLELKIKKLESGKQRNNSSSFVLATEKKILEIHQTKEKELFKANSEASRRLEKVKQSYEDQIKSLNLKIERSEQKLSQLMTVEGKLEQKEAIVRQKESIISDLREMKSSLGEQIKSRDVEIEQLYNTIREYQETVEINSLLKMNE